MLDLRSKKVFLFDLDDTLINTNQAKEIALHRSYQKLVSECVSGFENLPSYQEYYMDLRKTYDIRDHNGRKIYFDFDPEVFEEYCNRLEKVSGLTLKHHGFSLAARLCWHYRDTKNSSLMALPNTFDILNYLRNRCTVYCITEGKCNYQHTKAMLTDIETYVESVFVTNDKVNELRKFVIEKRFDKSEIVMIGDSENDIKAGINADIGTVCIKSGVRNYDSFKTKADLVLDNLNQLMEILKQKDQYYKE